MSDTAPPSESKSPASTEREAERSDTSSHILGETQEFATPMRAVKAIAFLAPPQAADELGRLGGYRVRTQLGAGGMGVVFLAEDVQLRRQVALKVMSPALAADETARQRFLREAQATAALHHDHVVTIYQVGEDRDVPFFAMELLAGESLDACLLRQGRLPLAETLRIGREIASGLDAAHEQKLIHRDIKPSNIWLQARKGQASRVKILDFGLVRVERGDARLTEFGMILGTPSYMSPEQAGGDSVDYRGDLFSLGCVLYRMVTGKLPFEGLNVRSILKTLMFESPRPVLQLVDVPADLARLIERLLAKDPKDRLQSAGAVVEALAALEAELAAGRQRLATTAPTPIEPRRADAPTGTPHAQSTMIAPPPGRTRRWGMIAAGIGVLALMLAVALVIFRNRGQEKPDPIARPKGVSIARPPVAIAPFNAKQAQDAWAAHLGVDVEITNSIGMTFRLIPPGQFTMGSTPEEIEAIVAATPPSAAWNVPNVRSEGPARRVQIELPYYLGIHEVTVGQFRAFVKEKDYKTWGERTGKGGRAWDSKLRRTVLKPDYIWTKSFVAATEEHPVVLVHREDVDAFCAWMSKKEGRSYRLPTEEQWEFACRADSLGRWYWGNDGARASEFGWFEDPATLSRQMPVGLKAPNAFGLHDMIGNIAEMTLDAQGAIVMRGGHAGYQPLQTRSASREMPNHTDPTYRDGFRVLLELNPKTLRGAE